MTTKVMPCDKSQQKAQIRQYHQHYSPRYGSKSIDHRHYSHPEYQYPSVQQQQYIPFDRRNFDVAQSNYRNYLNSGSPFWIELCDIDESICQTQGESTMSTHRLLRFEPISELFDVYVATDRILAAQASQFVSSLEISKQYIVEEWLRSRSQLEQDQYLQRNLLSLKPSMSENKEEKVQSL